MSLLGKRRRPPPPVSFWPDETVFPRAPPSVLRPMGGVLVVLALAASAALAHVAGAP
jgi:hypothetical protein